MVNSEDMEKVKRILKSRITSSPMARADLRTQLTAGIKRVSTKEVSVASLLTYMK